MCAHTGCSLTNGLLCPDLFSLCMDYDGTWSLGEYASMGSELLCLPWFLGPRAMVSGYLDPEGSDFNWQNS